MENMLNAINCAINCIEGTAGGFQKREKDAAVIELRGLANNIRDGKNWDGGDKPIPKPPGS